MATEKEQEWQKLTDEDLQRMFNEADNLPGSVKGVLKFFAAIPFPERDAVLIRMQIDDRYVQAMTDPIFAQRMGKGLIEAGKFAKDKKGKKPKGFKPN